MNRKATSLTIVNTTVASQAEAQRLAGLILKSRLAACAQLIPIHSIYRWQGKIESTPEYLLLAKTRTALVTPLMAFIKRHHPYEVPEILASPVTGAFGKYREWIEDETKRITHRTHGKPRNKYRKAVN